MKKAIEQASFASLNKVLNEYTALRLKRIKDLKLGDEFIEHLIEELIKNESLTLYDAVKKFSKDLELEEFLNG